MNPQAPAPTQRPGVPPLSRIRLSPAALLLVFAVLLAIARLHTFDEPTDRDLGDYMTIAHELHLGKHLYTDCPDQKPPAIHLTYYLAEAITGYGRGEVYLLTVGGSILAMLGVYFACGSLFESQAAALWAAAFWAAISGHVRLEGNQPNAELFMNAFLLLGIALIGRARKPGDGAWWCLVAAGVCFGWSSLYKQVIVVTPALIGLACIVVPPPGKSRIRALLEMLVVGGVIVSVWGLAMAALAAGGQLQAFIDTVFTYNIGYGGNLWTNLARSLLRIFPPWMTATWPLGIAGLLGILLGARRKQWAPVCILAALMVGTHIAVAMPGRFFPQYYQLWFPWLTLSAGFAVAQIGCAFGGRFASFAGVALVGALLAEELPNYTIPADEWSEIKYGSEFVNDAFIAHVIDEMLKPEETFYQMADETEFYAVSKRRPPSSILGVYGLYRGSMAPKFRRMMLNDLEKSKPDLLVVSRVAAYVFHDDPNITRFIRENYGLIRSQNFTRLLEYLASRGCDREFIFLTRNGSDLEKRVAQGQLRAGRDQ